MDRRILDKNYLPTWFEYPTQLLMMVKNSQIDIGPWSLMREKSLKIMKEGLKKQYPYRKLLPFARRFDCDDVACFDVAEPSDNPEVIIIHNYASPGWEGREEYDNFDSWLEAAKKDAEDWE